MCKIKIMIMIDWPQQNCHAPASQGMSTGFFPVRISSVDIIAIIDATLSTLSVGNTLIPNRIC